MTYNLSLFLVYVNHVTVIYSVYHIKYRHKLVVFRFPIVVLLSSGNSCVISTPPFLILSAAKRHYSGKQKALKQRYFAHVRSHYVVAFLNQNTALVRVIEFYKLSHTISMITNGLQGEFIYLGLEKWSQAWMESLLTLYVQRCFEETWRYVYIIYHIWKLRWCRWMKLFLMKGKGAFILWSPSHGCRWPCDTWNWGIINQGIELVTMMTSSNGNIFRVTGHLCGEFTGPRWIPRTKVSDAELWCFLWSASE